MPRYPPDSLHRVRSQDTVYHTHNHPPYPSSSLTFPTHIPTTSKSPFYTTTAAEKVKNTTPSVPNLVPVPAKTSQTQIQHYHPLTLSTLPYVYTTTLHIKPTLPKPSMLPSPPGPTTLPSHHPGNLLTFIRSGYHSYLLLLLPILCRSPARPRTSQHIQCQSHNWAQGNS